MAVITYNPLLGIGDPVQAALLAQATGAPVASPFASQMTSTGLLPMPGIPAQATNLQAAAPVEVVEPTAPVVRRTVAPAPMVDDTGTNAPAGSEFAVTDYQQGFAQTPEFFSDFDTFSQNYDQAVDTVSPAEIADAYRDEVLGNREDAYKVGNIFDQPISQTLGQVFANPSAAPGMLLGAGMGMGGGLLASGFLNAMDRMSTGQLARDYAMAQQGVPGYSVGYIGGSPYSIGPGLFGIGRTVRGNVPVGITIDDIERMGKISQGINPFGDGGGFVGGGMYGGPGGYTEDGGYVDHLGNYSAMGTMGALEDLADKFGVTTSDAKGALDQARDGKRNLTAAMYSATGMDDDDADMAGSYGDLSGFDNGAFGGGAADIL